MDAIANKTDRQYPLFICLPEWHTWWVIESPEIWTEYRKVGARWQRMTTHALAYPEKVRLADILAAADDPKDVQHAWAD